MKGFSRLRPAVCAFLLMAAMSTTTSAISFLNEPVAQDLGVGMGSFTLYYSMMVITGALSAPVVGQWLGKLGAGKLIVVSALWGLVCMNLFSVSRALWLFYLIGLAMGMLGSTALNLTANVILQTYYTTAEAAAMIGVVMAGSGLGSIGYSALMPGLLENLGWRWGYRILGLAWAGLLLLAFLILGRASPVSQEKTADPITEGMTRKEALRSPVLYLLLVTVLILDLGFGFAQHFPVLLSQQGNTPAQAGALMGFYSAVLTLGKILQGMLYGKFGVKKGSIPLYILYALGFLLLMHPSLGYPAFFCLGMGIGTLTTLVPVLAKTLFGQREYAGIYGIVSMAMAMGTFVATPCWGWLYDWTGSYRGGFPVMAVLLAAAFCLQSLALKLRFAGKTRGS